MNKLLYILILFSLTFPLSAQTKNTNPLVFEIIKSQWGGMNRSNSIFYIYRSGRIDCQNSKGTIQKNTVGKKYKCFQTTPAKISELVKLAEEADFRKAKGKYMLYRGGIDWGNSASIIHFNGKNKKKIELDHTEFEMESIPYSMQEFLRKIGEIDETMKIRFAFPKPDRSKMPQD